MKRKRKQLGKKKQEWRKRDLNEWKKCFFFFRDEPTSYSIASETFIGHATVNEMWSMSNWNLNEIKKKKKTRERSL